MLLKAPGTKKAFGHLHFVLLHPCYAENLDFIFSIAGWNSGRKKGNTQRTSPKPKFKILKTAINWNLWFTLKAVFERNSHINSLHYKLVSILLKNGISEKVFLPLNIKSTEKIVWRLTLDNCCTFRLTTQRGCFIFGFVLSCSQFLIFDFEAIRTCIIFKDEHTVHVMQIKDK